MTNNNKKSIMRIMDHFRLRSKLCDRSSWIPQNEFNVGI